MQYLFFFSISIYEGRNVSRADYEKNDHRIFRLNAHTLNDKPNFTNGIRIAERLAT